MLDMLLNTPLTYVSLRKIYLLCNDIKETKNKRPDITIQMIENWLKDNGYKLNSIKIYNTTLKKNMRYYKIVK